MSRGRRPDGRERAAAVRIDVEVFESFASGGLDRCGARPRIVRWLDCWQGG